MMFLPGLMEIYLRSPLAKVHFQIVKCLLCTYLLSQDFKFVRPGLYVRQSVADLSGLLSHASRSFLDGGQAAVSQLFDLEVQRCQVGAPLQLRHFETGGEQRHTVKTMLKLRLYYIITL